jgi:hypothetical protein
MDAYRETCIGAKQIQASVNMYGSRNKKVTGKCFGRYSYKKGCKPNEQTRVRDWKPRIDGPLRDWEAERA